MSTRLSRLPPADAAPCDTAVVAVTVESIVVSWNPVAEKLFGLKAAEAVGRPFSAFLPASEAPKALKALERVKRAQRAESLEAELLRRDGGAWKAFVTLSPIWWDAEGRVAGLSIAAEDRASRPAPYAESLLRAFERTATAAAVLRADQGTHELVNPAYARLHGYAVEELIGRPLRELLPPGLEAESGRGDPRVYASKRLRKDGTVIPVLVDATLVRDDDGRPLYDVTYVREPSKSGEGDAQSLARRLESVFACALDGLLVADPGGRIVLANERAARIFGVSKDELLVPMADYVKLFKPRSLPGAPAMPIGQLALQGRTVEPVERIITAADGAERFLRTGAAPLLGAGGDVEGAVIVIADVTEERRVQESLRASMARFRELVEGLDAIVWEADPDTWRFTYVNRPAEKMLGYPLERWLEDKDFWVHLIHPDDREAAVRSCREAVAAGRNNDFEYRVVAADGRTVWIRDLVYLTLDASRRPRRLRGIMFDITDRKRAEESLRERAEELRTLLESTPAIVWIAHDPEGRTITGNRASYELLRMPAGANASVSAPRGAPTHFRVLADGRELAPEQYPVQRAARGEEIRNFEEELVFDDGRRVRLLGHAVPIRDENGAPRGAIAAFVDITERVRAEAAIRDLNQTLEARVDARTRELRLAVEELNAFAYTVAHDLRAPLRSMTGYSDILLEDYRELALDAEGRDYLARIRDSALRMDALIQGLLEYSRLGRVENSLNPVDLGEVVADAVAQIRAGAEKKGAEISVEGPFPRIRGNRLLLTQSLNNLLSNAVKFAEEGKRPSVQVRAEERGDVVRLVVKDDGIGIPARYHDRVFGVFERLHPAHAYPGTGIGLAIVRRAVERMGGRSGLESSPGAGSTFWIELPKDR